MNKQCEKHGEMMQVIGEQVEANRQQTKQIGEIFTMLGAIKTAVDQNSVRADARDRKLIDIDAKIENGLKTEMSRCAAKIDSLFTCLERRKTEREQGFEGFFVKGWRKIHDNGGMIIILVVGYLILWGLVKMKIFSESPEGLFKLLGIG